MTQMGDALHEPDDEGDIVDQEAADIAAGPASAGETAGDALRRANLDPKGDSDKAVSAGEAISRGDDPTTPGA